MKRFLVLLSFLLLVFLSFIPVLNYGAAELRANAPILLDSVKLPEGYCILPRPSHSSEAMFENNSFEFVPKSLDVFSDINGFRPYPWGGEIFFGDVSFVCSKDSYMGRRSFMIQGFSKMDHGAIAVPDIFFKPNVEIEELYYVSFWVKYEIQEGGFRLAHQFFRIGDGRYPRYASYGPWISGSSYGDWKYIGLLVYSPSDAWKGDPVLEFKGIGQVFVDNAYFGKVKLIKEEDISENS
ncbi:MAG: hypothetical protein PHG13_00215 [Candidatus Pacebacteria bacterium]|nr:hypothetical protein [Candidatus Paceibacterota bacterium]MDD5721651.1 hypothetical protein [Candidatus Paceibacterota bacterium]